MIPWNAKIFLVFRRRFMVNGQWKVGDGGWGMGKRNLCDGNGTAGWGGVNEDGWSGVRHWDSAVAL